MALLEPAGIRTEREFPRSATGFALQRQEGSRGSGSPRSCGPLLNVIPGSRLSCRQKQPDH
jgi:hypothetical protein